MTDRRRRIVVTAVVLVIVLAAAELGVRALSSRLPPALVWHSPEAEAKVHRMDDLSRKGGADIVFVGSSMVNAGIDPSVFEEALGVRAYNAALSAAVPELTTPWTMDVVVPRLHPKVIVAGLSSFDFSDEVTAGAFYRAFADSYGGRAALGHNNPLDRVDRWLRDHSSLWAHKFQLRNPDTVLDALRGESPPPDPLVQEVEADGHTIYRNHDAPFSAAPGRGPRVANWSIGTTNPGAMRDLVNRARSEGIDVVLALMPVTDEYIARHPHGEADYDSFRAVARDMAAATGARVLDFSGIRDHAMFADVVHLNAAGTATFTPQLLAGFEGLDLVNR